MIAYLLFAVAALLGLLTLRERFEGTEAAFTELDENKDDKLSRGEFLTAEEQAQALLAETQATQADSIEELRGQSEFEAAIGKYQAARLEYKMKGTSTAKAIAEQWKAWIESQIQEAQATVDANANAITTFIQTYESSDSELRDLQTKLREVRTKGPELQTAYETEREATTSAEEMDASSYYIKAGIIVGIVTLGFVVTLYA